MKNSCHSCPCFARINFGRNLFYFLIAISIFFTFASPVFAFSDVPDDSKNSLAINYLFENNIIEGYDDGTFKPDQEISRAEALKISMLSAGIEIEDNDIELNFSDIDESSWFVSFIKTAIDLGIISGYSNNKFYPDKNINLAEGLKIIIESFNIKNPDLFQTETEYDDWFEKYFEISREDALLLNLENINPDYELTRGDLAGIIYQAIKFTENPEYTVVSSKVCRATYYGYDFAGHNTASGEPYNPEELTAAHKELPFGTLVRVTNLENHKSVIVRINDRGPFTKGLEIDLSQAAFSEIANISQGVIDAQMEVLEQK
jgi:rare lipoprotein A